MSGNAVNAKIVVSQARFERTIGKISSEPRIGIDLESNGFFRYPERICLIQISTADQVFLVDPLSIEDMTLLGGVLADEKVEIILHSGDYDIRSLDRDWDFHISKLFDTSIAAAFVGLERLGLGSVLEEMLEVIIPKEKSMQRSDWTIRPLSDEALTYAAEDVRHLFRLRDALGEKLQELGRVEWVTEECERLTQIRYEPSDPEMTVFNFKGSRDLDGYELAVLKSLLEYRESHALRVGRPHFRVIPDMALLALATKPKSDLGKVRGLGMYGRGRLAAELREAIERGMAADPLRRPPRPQGRRLSRDEREAAGTNLTKLKAWRVEQGKRLSLDPGLLWPMVSLQRLSRFPNTLEAELESPEVRRWQRAEFAESLKQVLS
jgi:ribonuclease D